MTKTTRVAVKAAMLMGTLLAVCGTASAETTHATIVVHVIDFVKIDTAELARAEEEASRIYAAVGVNIVWVTGDEETETVDAPVLHLRVLILDRERATSMINSVRVGDKVLGGAYKGAGRAYIYYFRVVDIAGRYGRTRGDVLGKVIAHEIGHLVLPVDGHSETGLMRANLDMMAMQSGFTEEQVAMIRGMYPE